MFFLDFSYGITRVQQSIFYDWFRYLLLFGLGCAVKSGEDEDDLVIEIMNHLMEMMFVEQLPAIY